LREVVESTGGRDGIETADAGLFRAAYRIAGVRHKVILKWR